MPPEPNNERETLRRRIVVLMAWLIQVVSLAVALYASPQYWRQPYHTSVLSGRRWVNELIHGHPDRIRNELGMRVHLFLLLVAEIKVNCRLDDEKNVTLEEQVAIFLYTCVTGLSIRHVGERFQRSNETISRYECVVFLNTSY